MQYKYTYPGSVQRIIGRASGRMLFPESHIVQTHDELMNRLDMPAKTVSAQVEIAAPRERIWEVAAGSIERFFSHHPLVAGISRINSLGSDEGGRYVIHRVVQGVVIDRVGEVLVRLPLRQLTVSDIDITDPSVCGFFQSLFSIKLDEHPTIYDHTLAVLSYTMLGVAPFSAVSSLIHQAGSIRKIAEVKQR